MGKSKVLLSPVMSSPDRKYLDFHHSPPEAVTPLRCASGQREPRSPCLSIPINTNLIGAPPAVCPWQEKLARSRGVRSAAAHFARRDSGMLSEGRLRCPCPAAPPGRPQSRLVLEAIGTWGEKTAVSQSPFGSLQNRVEKMCIRYTCVFLTYETCPRE